MSFKKISKNFKLSVLFFSDFYLLAILPLVQILTLIFAVGRAPMGLKLGIVNYEVPNMTQVNNSELIEKLSIKFLDEIFEANSTKIYYESFDDARNDVKNGKLIGFLNIAKNFTEIFLDSDVDINERNIYATNAIDVHLDKSNHQLSWFITQGLYDSYFRFDKKFLNKSQEGYPIRINTCFGNISYDFRQSIFSAFISG